MAGRLPLFAWAAIVLAGASGCATSRSGRDEPFSPGTKKDTTSTTILFPDNSSRPSFDNPTAGPNDPTRVDGSPVVPAGYFREQTPSNGGSNANAFRPNESSADPRRMPPATGFDPPYGTDPHLRSLPTAAGAGLNLAPGETPVERAVELLRKVESLATENLALRDKVRSLEAAGVEREQALRETLRDVDRATAEVAKARSDSEVFRGEMTKLRDRVRRVEEEEIETLKMIVDALRGLLKPNPDGTK